MHELLRKCRAILELSGIKNAANSGFLTRFGIANLDDLQRFKDDIDAALAGNDPQ